MVLLSCFYIEQAATGENTENGDVDPEGEGAAGEGTKKKKKKKKKKKGGGGEGEADDFLHPGANPTG